MMKVRGEDGAVAVAAEWHQLVAVMLHSTRTVRLASHRRHVVLRAGRTTLQTQ